MNWWTKNKDRLSKNRKMRWNLDAPFRKRQKDRDAKRREGIRVSKVDKILKDMNKRLIIAFGTDNFAVPRLGIYASETTGLTTTGLGYVLGRSQSTIQSWLAQGVLPGCSVVIRGWSLFDRPLCELIVLALYETLKRDLRGDSKVLKEILTRFIEAVNLEVLTDGSKEKSEEESKSKGN